MKIFNFSYENIGKTGKNDFDCFLHILPSLRDISVPRSLNGTKKFPTMLEILATLKTLKCVCKVK